ncbi:MAG: 30S ribosomal protein S20 [Anaerolineae bacterium]
MANTKAAEKAIRQNDRRRERNRWFVSRSRTFMKKTLKAIDAGDLDEAQAAFIEAQSALDKAAEKGIIHKNNASRHKSRLAQRIKQAQAAAASGAKSAAAPARATR